MTIFSYYPMDVPYKILCEGYDRGVKLEWQEETCKTDPF